MNASAEIHTVNFRAPSATVAAIFVSTAASLLDMQVAFLGYTALRANDTEVAVRAELVLDDAENLPELLRKIATSLPQSELIAVTLAPVAGGAS